MKRLVLAAAASITAAAFASTAFASLPVGAAAPDFKAKAALAGKEFDFDLKSQLKKGPVVLYFFPAAFTPGCTAEAHAFSEATEDYKKAGAAVVGITAGNVERVAEFSVKECSNKFAVVADPGAKIAAQYQSTLKMKPEWSDRTSYVIGKDGKIKFVHSEMNPSKHVEMTLAAVKGL